MTTLADLGYADEDGLLDDLTDEAAHPAAPDTLRELRERN